MRPAEDGGSGAVVARPDGDPEALEHAAADLRGAAGTFGRVGGGLRQGGAVGGWEGLASFAFENRCVTEASAVDSAAAACENAATVLNTLADDLRKAQKLCERAQDDATAAARRRAHARAEAESARLDASAARTDATAATARADRREATGAPATEVPPVPPGPAPPARSLPKAPATLRGPAHDRRLAASPRSRATAARVA